jgi:hypothetical protein
MRLLLFFISGCLCFGQSFSIGAKGGVRATDDITGAATSESKRYIIGPALDLGLPLGLGVEFDALYSRDGYRTSFANFAGSSFTRERANSWQFPLLIKYKLPSHFIKPYVEAGYATGILNGSADINTVTIDLLTDIATFGHSHESTNWKANHGIVTGGGVQLSFGRLRLSPEIRYTHWNHPAISGFYGNGPSYQSTQDQVDVLVGIGWRVSR